MRPSSSDPTLARFMDQTSLSLAAMGYALGHYLHKTRMGSKSSGGTVTQFTASRQQTVLQLGSVGDGLADQFPLFISVQARFRSGRLNGGDELESSNSVLCAIEAGPTLIA